MFQVWRESGKLEKIRSRNAFFNSIDKAAHKNVKIAGFSP